MDSNNMTGTTKPSLWREALRSIRKHGLLSGSRKLVIGVSGGPDSVCLLHMLAHARSSLGIELHAAHLNHGLRGSDADADAEYVLQLCRQLGIPVTIQKTDVSTKRRKHSPIEEAAREARYSFFARVVRDVHAGAVAVGHTADDHVETILLHLIRGAGTRGLRGLEPRSMWVHGNASVEVIRPLLEVSREHTVNYCLYNGLQPRQDISNLSPLLLRNRIRHELLPLLKEYNPAFSRALKRIASIAGDDIRALEAWVDQLWDDIVHRGEKGLNLDREKLHQCPKGLQRMLLRRALVTVQGSPRDIEASHIEAMVQAIDMPAGNSLSLLKGAKLMVGYDYLLIGKGITAPPIPHLTGEHPLDIPGETQIPGWLVKADIIDPYSLGEEEYNKPLDVYLDLSNVSLPLMVRCRRPGDRFQPLGMATPKKIQDFMVDAHIPRDWRDSIPLVYSPDQIVWIVGWRLDERVRVTEQTRQVLHLLFRKIL
ncbi:tRNA lysidine(34) synthetase TilS [Chloroflexota bacterium]